MKKLMFLLTLLAAGASAGAVEPTALRITTSAGSTDFLFDDKPEVAFTANGVQVSTLIQDEPVSFDFDQVESMTFVELDAVSNVEQLPVSVRVTTAALIIDRLQADSRVAVFALDGRKITEFTASDHCEISRMLLQKGIYILKINKSAFKISL